MSTLYENYITGDDGNQGFYLGAVFSWSAQTFTPSVSHMITSVNLKWLRFPGAPVGTATVCIKATDIDGKPTGADLASGTTDGDTITTVSPGEWREITFVTGASLTAGTKYAIICKSGADDNAHPLQWRKDGSAPSYTGGSLVTSDGPAIPTDGAPWTIQTAADMMFEEWGDPVIFPGTASLTLTTFTPSITFTNTYILITRNIKSFPTNETMTVTVQSTVAESGDKAIPFQYAYHSLGTVPS